jgi:hypothetical protein
MSQAPRLKRARQLTASVLPGRGADDYESLITGRLRKIAAAQSTGLLPFPGEGAIYFRDGKVSYAESARTPSPVPAGEDSRASTRTPLGTIMSFLAVAEPTIDATLELWSSAARFTRFRPAKVPAAAGLESDIPLEAMLAEVGRRHRLLEQLSAAVTPDTAVTRNPRLRPESIRVSARHWALLIRIRPGSTPRDLAWDMKRSVFGTTIEVYRLLALRLLSIVGDPAGGRGDTPGEVPGPGLAAMSFVRAVSVKKGSSMPLIDAGGTSGAVR